MNGPGKREGAAAFWAGIVFGGLLLPGAACPAESREKYGDSFSAFFDGGVDCRFKALGRLTYDKEAGL